MRVRIAWLVSITAAAGCGSAVGQAPPNQIDPNGVLVIGAPSTEQGHLTAREPAADSLTDDFGNGASTSEQKTIPERCAAYERRDPRPGDLAWISECQIKTAKPIYFQFNSDVIHVESESILQAIANLLHDDPTLRVEIGAHSDGKGSRQYNMDLTQKRADAVKNHLIGKGVDAERLIARGFGEDQPISHPPLVDGRRTNRRIEFVILAK